MQTSPELIDKRVLKAQSHPVRAHILNILSEGDASPARMTERMKDKNVSLQVVSHHVKVLRDVGLVELTRTKKHGGRTEHIYRATKRQYFTLEEWLAIEPEYLHPLVTTILEGISDDTTRAMVEGRFTEIPDSHLSRSPLELDQEGWEEVGDILRKALDGVLEAHQRSALRSQKSGEELMTTRVVIMQFPIGRDNPAND